MSAVGGPQGPKRAPGFRGQLRLAVVGIALTALFGALFVRLWYLQVIHRSTALATVAQNTLRKAQDPAPRGLIKARGGQVMVGNHTVYVVTLNRQAAANHPWVEARIAKLLGMTPAAVKTAMQNKQISPYAPVPLAVGVPVSTVVALRESQSSYPGVSVQLQSVRQYPYGSTASQLLGYVGAIDASELKALKGQGYQGTDQIGKSGVESSFERYLRGKPGVTGYEVDARGRVVGVASRKAPLQGDTMVLTLDLGLQQAVDSALSNEIQALRHQGYPATGGASVVLDPTNGQVLAMSSYPTYDPSVWVGGISEAAYKALNSPSSGDPLLNRVIDGLYTPGSTFKLATATAALQDGLITPSTIIDDSTGTFTVPNCHGGKCVFQNSGGEVLGPLDVSQALTASDDVFFYTLGFDFWVSRTHYGEDAIQRWAGAYGFGSPTGIALPGEASGMVDSPQVTARLHSQYPKAYPYGDWYVGNNIEMAFGQGVTVITPLQLALAYGTFANGGTRYEPQVAAAIVDPQGRVVKRFSPVVTGHVQVSSANRAALLSGFEGAVADPRGTAYSTFAGFPLNKLQVAGKTGTATTNLANLNNSVFVGFAPATDAHYVVATVISEAGFGATGAAVATRSIFSYLVNHPPGKVTP
ncbi:MAG: penicillin-binding protein 2 [Acidimicrobiales bacterium]